MNPSKRKRVEEIKRDLNYQYMNRENYLKGFNSIREINNELWYLMKRLEEEEDILLIAILEMKLKDIYEKGKVMERESRIEKEGN